MVHPLSLTQFHVQWGQINFKVTSKVPTKFENNLQIVWTLLKDIKKIWEIVFPNFVAILEYLNFII